MLVDQSGQVWAMRRDDVVAAQALQMRADRAAGLTMQAYAGVALEGSDFAVVVDGVAIIPVLGPLMRKMSYWAWSYEEIARDVTLALADRNVRSIVLDIDSPGGMVAGCEDCASLIHTAKGKPITAFVGGRAASAAYWIASAAQDVVVGSGAILGSIGAVIEYVDIEPMFEKMGARVIRVVSEQSPNKRLDADSPEGRAEMQALVDASGAAFVAAVARQRGVAEAVVMERFGQGLVFEGATAIARGLADRRATLDDIVAGLAGRDVPRIAAPAAAAQESPMEWDTLTLAALQQHRPDLIEAIGATAAAEATLTAASAERARLTAIDAIAVEGHEALVTAAKADGVSSAADVALRILQAEKQAGSTYLANRAAADAQVAVAAAPLATSTTDAAPGASVEDRAAATWAKDEALRAEFGGDQKAYVAWLKASEASSARVLRKA